MFEELSAGCQRALIIAGKMALKANMVKPNTRQCLIGLLGEEEGFTATLLAQVGLTQSKLISLQKEIPTDQNPPLETLPGVRNLARRIIRASRDILLETEGTSSGFLYFLMTEMEGARVTVEEIGISWEGFQDKFKKHLPEPLQLESPLDFGFETENQNGTRILDAAANRVREGMRVIEDFLRFNWDDAIWTECAKKFRHDFQQTLTPYQSQWFLSSRNVTEDVGLEIRTNQEKTRESLDDVLKANFKRVQEALRSLEEFGKLIDGVFPEKMAQFRYQSYEMEKNIVTRLKGGNPYFQAKICVLANQEQLEGIGFPALKRLLRQGLDVIQLRDKNASDRELLSLGKKIREITQQTNSNFVINDRPDLARLVGADGVHLGQEDLNLAQARAIAGNKVTIGISTHTKEQAIAAVIHGADYLGIGPTFSSKTKSIPNLAGLPFVEFAAKEVKIPWFAIGGINQGNILEVKKSGASRIAISSALFDALDPEEELAALLRKMG